MAINTPEGTRIIMSSNNRQLVGHRKYTEKTLKYTGRSNMRTNIYIENNKGPKYTSIHKIAILQWNKDGIIRCRGVGNKTTEEDKQRCLKRGTLRRKYDTDTKPQQ